MRWSTWKDREGSKKVAVLAQQFAKFQTTYHMLTILGGVGRGKTHLVTAIGWDWLEAGYFVLFYQTERLLDMLRASFDQPVIGQPSEATFDQRMHWLEVCDLLILDDLGVEKQTDWGRAKLDTIVDYRYLHLLPLVVTTNLTLEELPMRVADRLADRRQGKVLMLSCSSYRSSP